MPKNCSKCEKTFEEYPHNPYNLCLTCAKNAEALADLTDEIVKIRQARLPESCRASSEDEYMARPNSERYRIMTGNAFVRGTE